MIPKLSNNQNRIYQLLKDGKPHFSAEFRDQLGLLEYRKRISELRVKGFQIKPLNIGKRPAYKMIFQTEEPVAA